MALLVASTLLTGGACEKAARRHPLTFEDQVYTFHMALRQQNILDAAAFVAPARRESFVASWQPAQGRTEFTDLEVTRMQTSADGEFAQVEATLTYVMNGSLNVRQHRLFELWKGIGAGWHLDGELPPPPELATKGGGPDSEEAPMAAPIYVQPR
jgi:hypothetical protein